MVSWANLFSIRLNGPSGPFGIVNSLFVLLIGYHILSGQVAGPTAYGNMLATIVLGALFFTQSKK